MSRPSYARPDQAAPLADIKLRPLVSLNTPPPPSSLPPLPSPPRTSLIDESYILTTHLVPAAYPRTTPDIPEPHPPKFTKNREQFRASTAKIFEKILDIKRKEQRGELSTEGSRVQLWSCVNRYVKRDQSSRNSKRDGKPLTLFFAHANGFPKEIWEPTLRELLARNTTLPEPLDIQEIWLWEAVNHGDAALVNSGKLGGLYDWIDNTRDILHFLLNYIPSSPYAPALPTHLERLPESTAEARQKRGWDERILIPVGHSFGGCTSCLAAVNIPVLFDALILVDPIIRPLHPGAPIIKPDHHARMTADAVRRRGHWESREEALKLLRASPFFGTWHPDVLDIYVQCGMYDDPRGGVSLKMPGIQEAIVFAEAWVPYEAWILTSRLDERIELRWIMPEIDPTCERLMLKELVWRRPANSSNVMIPNAGHLIPQEAPQAVADEIHQFLARKYSPFRRAML